MDPDDEAAFRAFVAARSGALLHTARLLAPDAHAAEDLLQEALSRLVPRWRRVDDPEAYARTTMHRLQISRWRRLRIVREHSNAEVPDAGEQRPARDEGRAVDDRLVLTAALGRLTARQRGVLVCRYVEDLDERRTAELLGVSVGTVRSTASLMRALGENVRTTIGTDELSAYAQLAARVGEKGRIRGLALTPPLVDRQRPDLAAVRRVVADALEPRRGTSGTGTSPSGAAQPPAC
jgi:RNA polymerase sigma-70 factor (sigma-E family)